MTNSQRIHELAVRAVCPSGAEPSTVFEINMVKMLEEFGNKVAALPSSEAGADEVILYRIPA